MHCLVIVVQFGLVDADYPILTTSTGVHFDDLELLIVGGLREGKYVAFLCSYLSLLCRFTSRLQLLI